MNSFVKTLAISCILLLVFICSGCRHDTKMNQAQERADMLWSEISNGSASKEFPEKYFPAEQRDQILNNLKYRCQIQQAKGKLAGRRYFRDFKNGVETASLAYEFPLQCDTVRFILS